MITLHTLHTEWHLDRQRRGCAASQTVARTTHTGRHIHTHRISTRGEAVQALPLAQDTHTSLLNR